jgi:hypothetical protein
VTRTNHRLHTERLLAVRFVPLLDGVPDHDPDT